MLTVGIDLAAEPEGTAVAWVEWLAGRAVVRDLAWGADDAAILAVGIGQSIGQTERTATRIGGLRGHNTAYADACQAGLWPPKTMQNGWPTGSVKTPEAGLPFTGDTSWRPLLRALVTRSSP